MKIGILAASIFIAMIGTGAAQLSQANEAAAVPTSHLTRKQAERLINTANSPEAHHALAEFFHHEAEEKRNKEQYYLEVVSTYRLHPPRVDSYRNTPTQSRYEQMADGARDEALADDRRAFLQEQFAEGLATPQGPRGVTTTH
jgi:hypothetical protein